MSTAPLLILVVGYPAATRWCRRSRRSLWRDCDVCVGKYFGHDYLRIYANVLSSRTRFAEQAGQATHNCSAVMDCKGSKTRLRNGPFLTKPVLWTFEDCSNIAFHTFIPVSAKREFDSQSLAFAPTAGAPVHLVDFIEAAETNGKVRPLTPAEPTSIGLGSIIQTAFLKYPGGYTDQRSGSNSTTRTSNRICPVAYCASCTSRANSCKLVSP